MEGEGFLSVPIKTPTIERRFLRSLGDIHDFFIFLFLDTCLSETEFNPPPPLPPTLQTP